MRRLGQTTHNNATVRPPIASAKREGRAQDSGKVFTNERDLDHCHPCRADKGIACSSSTTHCPRTTTLHVLKPPRPVASVDKSGRRDGRADQWLMVIECSKKL